MFTYCLKCNNNTKNIVSKKVSMANKVIKQKSRCVDCMAKKSRLLKQKFFKTSPKFYIY